MNTNYKEHSMKLSGQRVLMFIDNVFEDMELLREYARKISTE